MTISFGKHNERHLHRLYDYTEQRYLFSGVSVSVGQLTPEGLGGSPDLYNSVCTHSNVHGVSIQSTATFKLLT